MCTTALPVAVLSFIGLGAATAPHAHAQSPGVSEFPLTSGYDRPLKIVTGPDHNLWFTELTGSNIGTITPSGTITEYAKPPGSLDGVDTADITNGPDGNLWFTDFGTNSVGTITTSGVITEYALPGSDTGPWGIAAGADGNLWVTQENSGQVAKVTTSGAVTEYGPIGVNNGFIAAGSDGNLWFTDTAVDKIGQITTAGVITEYALATGSQPNGIVSGPDNNIWFTEQGTSNIGKMATTGALLAEYPIITGGAGLEDIERGPDGNLWFAENGSNTIGSVTTGGAVTEYPLGTSSGPFGITAGPNGNIWYTGYRAPSIGTFSLSGACLADSVGQTPVGSGSPETVQVTLTGCGVAPLNNATTTTTTAVPTGCPAAPAIPPFNSSLSYAQTDSHTTTFVAPSCSGTYTVTSQTTVGTTVVATASTSYRVLAVGDAINYPTGACCTSPSPGYVADGGDGNIWFVASYQGSFLGQVSPSGVVTLFPFPGIGAFTLLTSGSDGNLYLSVPSGTSDRIEQVSPSSSGPGSNWLVQVSGGPLNALAPGPDGNVWFATNAQTQGGDGTVGFVTRFDKVKEFKLPAGSGSPLAITSGSDGALWFTLDSHRMGRITTSGVVTLFAVPGSLSLASGDGAAVGPDGNVWVTAADPSTRQNYVVSISPSGSVREFPTPTPDSAADGITAGADGNLWFNEHSNNIYCEGGVGRITPSGTITEYVPGCTDANDEFNIVAGPDGNVWNSAYYANGLVVIETGAPQACTGVSTSASPSTVAHKSTETVSTVIRNCDSVPHLMKLVSKTTPPSGCGTPTTSTTVHVPLQPRVQTTSTSTFTAPRCPGVYKVKSTLYVGSAVVGSAATTYRVA